MSHRPTSSIPSSPSAHPDTEAVEAHEAFEANEAQECDYEVGYAKPPKETRFKKGESGNPRGRPRKPKPQNPRDGESFIDIVGRVLATPVDIKKNNKIVPMSSYLAIMYRLQSQAIAGDAKLLKLLRGHQEKMDRIRTMHPEVCKQAIFVTDTQKLYVLDDAPQTGAPRVDDDTSRDGAKTDFERAVDRELAKPKRKTQSRAFDPQSDLDRVLGDKFTVTIGGKRHKVTIEEIVLRQTVKNALAGKLPDIKEVLKLAETYAQTYGSNANTTYAVLGMSQAMLGI